MTGRDKEKSDYHEFRCAATMVAAEHRDAAIARHDDRRLRVEHTANVQMTEHGAFVEAVIWIPRSVIEGQRKRKANK